MATLEVKLTTLSPLHIGSGHVYSPFDAVIKNRHLYVVEVEEIVRYLHGKGKSPEEINALVLQGAQSTGIEALIDKTGISPVPPARFTMELDCPMDTVNDVREFIKSPLYNINYLPGSSLKGAIRTAVLWHELSKKGIKVEPQTSKRDIERIESDELGKFNKSVMRHFQVSDSINQDGKTGHVMEIKVSTPNPHAKVMRWLKNAEDLNSATSLFYECLREGEIFDFLVNIEQNRDKNKIHLISPENIINACRHFCKYQLLKDLEYLKDFRLLEEPLKNFYRNLVHGFNELQDNECIIRMGWGPGWLSKTFSSLIKDNHSEFFAQNSKFFGNRKGIAAEFFPKSRRFVIKAGACYATLGWVKLQFPGDKVGTTDKVTVVYTDSEVEPSEKQQKPGQTGTPVKPKAAKDTSALKQSLGSLFKDKSKPLKRVIKKGSLIEAEIERTDGHMADLSLIIDDNSINKKVTNVRLPFGQSQPYQKGQTVTIQVEAVKNNVITKCKIVPKGKT